MPETDEYIEVVAAEKLKEALSNSGLLVHKQGVGHLDFQFVYLGYPFTVRAQATKDLTSIDIRSVIGNIPYTSESYNSRAAVAKILSTISKKNNMGLTLTQNQRLILNGKTSNDDSLTPTNLLTMVTELLLQAKPYLILLLEYVKPSDENILSLEDSRDTNVVINQVAAD